MGDITKKEYLEQVAKATDEQNKRTYKREETKSARVRKGETFE